MSDPDAVAAYRVAFSRRAVSVTVQRIVGLAPNTTTTSAQVTAVVSGYAPTGGEAYSGDGEITRGQRKIIVMEQDLIDQGFPVPMQKNDKIILPNATEKLNVVDVDAETRRLGGAIELQAIGVS